jgi:hypothetical protein
MKSLKKLLIKKLAKENKYKKMSLKFDRKKPNKDYLKKKPKLSQKIEKMIRTKFDIE